jgi:hypothetical protein
VQAPVSGADDVDMRASFSQLVSVKVTLAVQ